MDGTGQLFGAFLGFLSTDYATKIVSYPHDTYLSYQQLEELVYKELPLYGKYMIIAESFSGPIALRLANRAPGDLVAIVLLSSFAYQPLRWKGFLFARLPLKHIFRLPLPDLILKAFLLGNSALASDVKQLRQAIRQVSTEVLARRLKAALTSDYGKHQIRRGTRVLAIFAENDHLLGRGARRSIVEVCPNAEIETVPGPHLALQIAPAAVFNILRKRGLP
jgi:pimeloyl-ACP methyl ester carboxylesterase